MGAGDRESTLDRRIADDRHFEGALNGIYIEPFSVEDKVAELEVD
jgi:hypothetical protein